MPTTFQLFCFPIMTLKIRHFIPFQFRFESIVLITVVRNMVKFFLLIYNWSIITHDTDNICN